MAVHKTVSFCLCDADDEINSMIGVKERLSDLQYGVCLAVSGRFDKIQWPNKIHITVDYRV